MLAGHKSGETCPLGSEPSTRTYAVGRGRSDNLVSRTYLLAPRAGRRGTIGRWPAAQSGNGNCARRQRVWRGGGARSSCTLLIYKRNRGGAKAKIECELARLAGSHQDVKQSNLLDD